MGLMKVPTRAVIAAVALLPIVAIGQTKSTAPIEFHRFHR
jgi:hypothetical protein